MKRSELRRTGGPRRKARVSAAKRLDRIPSSVRIEVKRRSGGWCEVCQTRRAEHMHHRKLRAQGGEHTAANLLHVDHDCHHWVHMNPAESYARGWLVKSWDTP